MIEGIDIRWPDSSIRGIFCDYDAFNVEIEEMENVNTRALCCRGFLELILK
jgi:hypothetical protein